MLKTSKGLLKVIVNGQEIKLNIERKPVVKHGNFEVKNRYLITWGQKLKLNDVMKIEFYPTIDTDFLEFNSDEMEQYICYENRSKNFAMTLGLDVSIDFDDSRTYDTEGFNENASRLRLELYNNEMLEQVEHGLGLAWVNYQTVDEEQQYFSILAWTDFASEPNGMIG